jgi:hypothetical protein
MSAPLNTNSPLSYPSWLKYQNALAPDTSVQLYSQYLKDWYAENTLATASSTTAQIKQDYIQLLKDLSFLFNKEEQDLFLSQLDYNNDEEITIAIPYFVQKLKEISKIFSYKRESIKNAKIRYNLIGSNNGLETLLYQYVLNGFTTKENNITQVPVSSLSQYFPALSSVNGNFFIELEELHDSQTYHDSDPSVPITSYVDVASVMNNIPFENLSENDVLGILSTRYLSRVADTPLSRLFNQYLSEVPTLSTATLSANAFQSINNQIVASQKYLSENVYGLTAVRLSEVEANSADYTLNLPFATGNNWFYWPSGDRIVDDSLYNNIFSPVLINNSNFVSCSATGGSDYTDSDLLFTDQSGVVEGAWLRGPRTEYSSDNMQLTINAGEFREFIYPYAGFNISKKSTSFVGYSLNDADYFVYQQLIPEQRIKILTDYYTGTLPNSASLPIYLNNTTLVYDGAFAGSSSNKADTITVTPNHQTINPIYSDSLSGNTQQAFLYALSSTDFPVSIGTTDIIWPIGSFDSLNNIPLTVLDDTCLPVRLSDLSISQSMLGCVAGTGLSDSDVIYKLNSRTSEPMEAAWLGSGSIQNLSLKSKTNVYNTSATNCASYIDGQIQGGLSTKINPGLVSFVWMDEDTPADQVIFYRDHAVDCPYYKNGPYNYYTNQDFQNPTPINNLTPWNNCRCKSVYYSPIGHEGQILTEYNGMADYLFADPQGLGVDFALNSWVDTRGYTPKTSPQFSFYQLDGMKGDRGVGFGSGKWQTGSGDPMILKTGRRYTYYRTSLRADSTSAGSSVTPYLIVTYAYKYLRGTYISTNPLDLVILIDVSASEFNAIQNTLSILKQFINAIGNSSKIQISLIYFDRQATIQTLLTSDLLTLNLAIDSIQVPYNSPSTYQTDIYAALQLANSILTTTSSNQNQLSRELYSLCSQLNALINSSGTFSTSINVPNPNAKRKILVVSDGFENVETGSATPYAETLKANGIDIVSLAIGSNTYYSDVMQQLASPNSFFNLEDYLNTNDGDSNSFIQRLATFFTSSVLYPTWFKAIRGTDGSWVTTSELSDMEFLPGDYLVYVHQANANFTGSNNTSFSMPSIAFAFNAKLNGWDYYSNTFNPLWIGNNFGAKPFWALSNVAPDSNLDNKFYKGEMSYGGQVTFVNGYLPIHQPPISNIVLQNGDFIQYNRKLNSNLTWNQPLNFTVSLSSYQWNKIVFYEGTSNLEDLFRIKNVSDFIAYSSYEPSDILLQGYTSFNPSRYNYYARNPFTYKQSLYLSNRCTNSFVQFNTALALQTTQPYANLDNVHFPTIASVALPSLAVSDKQTGEYLLPENLGVSYYRGRGYTIQVSGDTLTFIDSISAERMFLDINKYGPRNRGLTKKDQNSPVQITSIDNRWMYQSYSNSTAAGTIIDTLNNQKFTPYQSKYEITQKNDLGLCRQGDDFSFWNPVYPSVWDQSSKYPVTFRQELLASSYQARKDQLLVNKGVMTDWKIDIFGNNYGLFKVPGSTESIPNVVSTMLGSLSGSAYGCGTPSMTQDQINYSTSNPKSFQFNPPVLLPEPRQ